MQDKIGYPVEVNGQVVNIVAKEVMNPTRPSTSEVLIDAAGNKYRSIGPGRAEELTILDDGPIAEAGDDPEKVVAFDQTAAELAFEEAEAELAETADTDLDEAA